MRFVRRISTTFAAAGLLLVGGCVEGTDPAVPCSSLDLGIDDQVGFVSPRSAPVLAMTAPGTGPDGPVVLHPDCPPGAGCSVTAHALPVSSSDELLLTSGGGFVVALAPSQNTIRSIELLPDGAKDRGNAPQDRHVTSLVASLRGSDTVIVRALEGGATELFRFEPRAKEFRRLAPSSPWMKVIAVGERYAVGRATLDGAHEALYLIPVRPRDASELGHPTMLAKGPNFTRVVFTPGDERVVATSGDGNDARTLVYSVAGGERIDHFAGAAVSGLRVPAEIPGMSAVSPDGSHLAYRTPTGALALRDLDQHGSCMVRSSNAGDHRLAGFAADGTLYMESTPGSSERREIHSFDASTQTIRKLGDDDRSYHLAAVPARRFEMDGENKPWAVAVSDGAYFAVERTDSEGLGLGDVVFLPRQSGSMWVLDSQRCDPYARYCERGEDEETRYLWVRRIEPSPDRDADEDVYDMEFTSVETGFVDRIVGNRRVCMSSGAPGSWGGRCGSSGDRQFLRGPFLPPSEEPEDTPAPEPDGP